VVDSSGSPEPIEGFAGVEVAAAGCLTKEVSCRVSNDSLCSLAVNFFTLTFRALCRNHIATFFKFPMFVPVLSVRPDAPNH